MGCGGSKVAPEKGKKPGQQQSNQQPKVKASSNADDMKKGKESVTSKDQASKKSKSNLLQLHAPKLFIIL
jgi:phosphosulfolactate synthase (CoM biosynthesis protein A)